MPFNSYEFVLVFLPAAVVGHWLLVRFAARTAQSLWLLLASVAFYAYASITALSLIAPLVIFNYLIARTLLRAEPDGRARSAVFVASITINVAILAYFKYRNFFVAGTDATPVLLPLGLSFLVFQNIAFLSDVYSSQLSFIKLTDFLLFSLFFPRIAAGPIVRYGEIAPQFSTAETATLSKNIAVGLSLFSFGLFKKVVIADQLAPYVQLAFDAPMTPPPPFLTAWTGAVAYTLQLYFDFSGYSDMAIGIARMFNIRFPINFNSPLKATSIVEFWSRWHITLTRFLTAYIYTPLLLALTRRRLRKRKSVVDRSHLDFSSVAVLIGLPAIATMTVSGLWHGAGWQFIAWGVLHGIYLTINQSWRLIRPRIWPDHVSYRRVMTPVGFLLTFMAVVVAHVFFRAPSIGSAYAILAGMIGVNGILPPDVQFLHSLRVPSTAEFYLRLFEQPLWIAALVLIVTLAPNSLELLRRFRPALDFSGDSLDPIPHKTTVPPPPPSRTGKAVAARYIFAARTQFDELQRNGLSLSRRTAAAIAVAGAIGLLSLNRAAGFLYWHF